MDATENWWNCSVGPNKAHCATVSGSGVTYAPWLTRPFEDEAFAGIAREN